MLRSIWIIIAQNINISTIKIAFRGYILILYIEYNLPSYAEVRLGKYEFIKIKILFRINKKKKMYPSYFCDGREEI